MLPNGHNQQKRIQQEADSSTNSDSSPLLTDKPRLFRGPITMQRNALPAAASTAPVAETSPSHAGVHMSSNVSNSASAAAGGHAARAQQPRQQRHGQEHNYARNQRNGQSMRLMSGIPPRPCFGQVAQPCILSPPLQPTAGGRYAANAPPPGPIVHQVPLVLRRINVPPEQNYFNMTTMDPSSAFHIAQPVYAASMAGPVYVAPQNVSPVYVAGPNAAPMFAFAPNGARVFARPARATCAAGPSGGGPVFPTPPLNGVDAALLAAGGRNPLKPQKADFGYFSLLTTWRTDGQYYVPAKWVERALRKLFSEDASHGQNMLQTVTGCMLLRSVKASGQEVIVYNNLAALDPSLSNVQERCTKNDPLIKCKDATLFVHFVMHAIDVMWGHGAFTAAHVPQRFVQPEFGLVKFANGKIVPYVVLKHGLHKYVPTAFFPPPSGLPELCKFRVDGLPHAYAKYCCVCLNLDVQEIWRLDFMDVYSLSAVHHHLAVVEEDYKPSEAEYRQHFEDNYAAANAFPEWLAEP